MNSRNREFVKLKTWINEVEMSLPVFRTIDCWCKDYEAWVSLAISQRWLLSHNENTPIQLYWKFYHQKNENFQIKNSDIFHISAQNIDCGYSLEPPRRGGSNEYPQSMFWAEIRKIMYTPVNPSFTI